MRKLSDNLHVRHKIQTTRVLLDDSVITQVVVNKLSVTARFENPACLSAAAEVFKRICAIDNDTYKGNVVDLFYGLGLTDKEKDAVICWLSDLTEMFRKEF